MWYGEETDKLYKDSINLFCEKHHEDSNKMDPKQVADIAERKFQLFWVVKVRTMDPLLFQAPCDGPIEEWLTEIVDFEDNGHFKNLKYLTVDENSGKFSFAKRNLKEIIVIIDSVSTYVLSSLFKVCCSCENVSSGGEVMRYFIKKYANKDIVPFMCLPLDGVVCYLHNHQHTRDIYKNVCNAFKAYGGQIIAAAFAVTYYHFMDVCDNTDHALSDFFGEMDEIKTQMENDRKKISENKDEGDVRLIAKCLFKSGDYVKAISLYSAGLTLSAYNYFFFGNRAQSLINLKYYDEAEIDCRSAVILNPRWSKGYYRLAKALEGQNRIHAAHSALSVGMKTCQETSALLEFCNKLIDLCNIPECKASKQCELHTSQATLETGDSDIYDDVPELASSCSSSSGSSSDVPELLDSSSSDSENSYNQEESEITLSQASAEVDKTPGGKELPVFCYVSHLVQMADYIRENEVDLGHLKFAFFCQADRITKHDVGAKFYGSDATQKSFLVFIPRKNEMALKKFSDLKAQCYFMVIGTLVNYSNNLIFILASDILSYEDVSNEQVTKMISHSKVIAQKEELLQKLTEASKKLPSTEYSQKGKIKIWSIPEVLQYIGSDSHPESVQTIDVTIYGFIHTKEVVRPVLSSGDSNGNYAVVNIFDLFSPGIDIHLYAQGGWVSFESFEAMSCGKCPKLHLAITDGLIGERDGQVCVNALTIGFIDPYRSKSSDVKLYPYYPYFTMEVPTEKVETSSRSGKNEHGKQKKVASNSEHELACKEQSLEHFLDCLKIGCSELEAKFACSAAYRFHEALSQVNLYSEKYNFGDLSVVCLKYAYATACSKCGSLEDLNKAIAVFKDIIDSHPSVQFPGAYFGLGYCYYKMNDFKTALKYLKDVPVKVDEDERRGVYTWPGTEKIIDELKSENLKASAKELMAVCERPPPPDAVCRFSSCSFKSGIYYTDLDFRGFISVVCSENCKLQYHVPCWKSLKDSFVRTDKEFLGMQCLTPDCEGCIVRVEVVGKSRNVEKYFESDRQKKQANVKQKRSKLEKKLEIREQRRRKRHRSRSMSESHEVPAEEANLAAVAAPDNSETKPESRLPSVSNKEKLDLTEYVPIGDVKSEAQPLPQETPVYVFRKETGPKDSENKSSKHKEKKKPKKAIYSIDEFCDGFQSENVSYYNEYQLRLHRLRESKRIAEEIYWPTFCERKSIPQLDPNRPYHIPEDLRNDPKTLETVLQSYGLDYQCEDLTAKKEAIYSQIEGLIHEKGPLKLHDCSLLEKIERLPEDSKDIIEQCGGFNSFIQQSMRFAIVGETLCLFSEMCSLYNSGRINELDNFDQAYAEGILASSEGVSSKTVHLNPNAAEYSPPEHVENDSGMSSFKSEDADVSTGTTLLSTITKLRQPLSSYKVGSEKSESSEESLVTSEGSGVSDSVVETLRESLQGLLKYNLPGNAIYYLKEALKNIDGNQNTPNTEINSLRMVDKEQQAGCPEIAMLSEGTMKEDAQMQETLDQLNELMQQNEELVQNKTQLELNLAEALDNITKLQNKWNVDLPDVMKRYQETQEEIENENRQLKNKISQLEKEVKQWKQKHEQAIESKKEHDKEIARLHTKHTSEVKELEEKCTSLEEKIKKQSGMIEKYQKLSDESESCLKEKTIEALQAIKRARKAEVDLLSVKKNEYLKRLDLSIKATKQKRLELQGGMQQSEANLTPLLTSSLKVLLMKLDEHLKTLHAIRVTVVESIDEQISQVEIGHSLSELGEIKFPEVPEIPTVEQLMPIRPDVQPTARKAPLFPGQHGVYPQQHQGTMNMGAFQQAMMQNPNFFGTQHLQYNQPNPLAQIQHLYPLLNQANHTAASKFPNTNVFNQNPTSKFSQQFASQSGNDSQSHVPSALSNHSSLSSSVSFPPGLPSEEFAASAKGSEMLENLGAKLKTSVNSDNVATLPRSKASSVLSAGSPSRSVSPAASLESGAAAPVLGNDVDDVASNHSFKSLPVQGPLLSSRMPTKFSGITSDDASSSSAGRARLLKQSSTSQKLGHGSEKPGTVEKPTNVRVGHNVEATATYGLGAAACEEKKSKKSYGKLFEKLKDKFPDIPEKELKMFVAQYREQKTKLSGMSMDAIVSGVSELIKRSKAVNKPKQPLPKVLSNKPIGFALSQMPDEQEPESKASGECPWNKTSSQPTKWEGECPDDKCAICLEHMNINAKDVLQLDCGHYFHHPCIKSWTDSHSSCPTCRMHILMPDDYPALS